MYAINCAFEKRLSKHCDSKTHNKFYDKIKNVLNEYGFTQLNDSFYIGRDNIDGISAFRCVMTLNELTNECPHLQEVLKDVRIIEIDPDFLPEIREKV